jgi:hypothetical protein
LTAIDKLGRAVKDMSNCEISLENGVHDQINTVEAFESLSGLGIFDYKVAIVIITISNRA